MMAAQVNLYNKYRPVNLNEIVGQDAISRVLANAVLKNRIANAYLLRGPRGSGKTSVARILCRVANCEYLQGFTACGKCNGCRYALHDANELDAASNRGIDVIKELISNLAYRPQHVDKKFVIIDEAHQLTAASVNALLKSVEEPPKHVHFMFCTTNLPSLETDTDKAFMTLSSRCQILQFHKVSPQAMMDKLARICIAENRIISRDLLMGIIGKSDGSLRDAENILDTVLTFSDSEPSERIIQFLYGDIESLALDLFRNCCLGTVQASFLSVRQLWDYGCNPSEVAEFCLKFATDVLYLQAGLTVYRTSATVERLEEISKDVKEKILETVTLAFSNLTHSYRDDLLSLEMVVCDIFIDSNARIEMDSTENEVIVGSHAF